MHTLARRLKCLFRLLIYQQLNKFLIFAYNYTKCKLRPFSILALNSDHSLERLNNFLRNYKPQTDSLCVHLSGVLQTTKQFEEFDAILLLDADAGIFNLDYDLVATSCWRIDDVEVVFFVEGGGVTVGRV